MPRQANNIVIPEFSAWLTLVLEQCRAENIRNLPRQRAITPSFPERRPREMCSMPISGRYDLPLATFNLPSRNGSQSNRKRIPPHRHSGISRASGPERRPLPKKRPQSKRQRQNPNLNPRAAPPQPLAGKIPSLSGGRAKKVFFPNFTHFTHFGVIICLKPRPKLAGAN